MLCDREGTTKDILQGINNCVSKGGVAMLIMIAGRCVVTRDNILSVLVWEKGIDCLFVCLFGGASAAGGV